MTSCGTGGTLLGELPDPIRRALSVKFEPLTDFIGEFWLFEACRPFDALRGNLLRFDKSFQFRISRGQGIETLRIFVMSQTAEPGGEGQRFLAISKTGIRT